MSEENDVVGDSVNEAPQRHPSTRRTILSSRLPTFRSSSAPLSPVSDTHNRNPKDTRDSLRPPLLHPHSVIPHKEANLNYDSDPVIPIHDRLGNFRRLVGIDSSPTHALDAGYHRPAENIGIYTRVVREEVISRAQYTRYSILINTALGAQIIVAAALTALGAGDGPRSAVTVFGAFNTVCAGILAFLKGSGLPNRQKYYANEWAKVREYIEQRERDFGRAACTLDVDTEVHRIEIMYNEVKQDVEANTPDGFSSVSNMKKMAASLPSSLGGVKEKHESEATLHGGHITPGGLEAGMRAEAVNGMSGLNSAPTAGPGSGVGLGSGPGMTAQFQHPSESLQSKLADRLSSFTAAEHGSGHSGLPGGASKIFDTVTRLSHKIGADDILSKLQHLEHAHDTDHEQLSREGDRAVGSTSAEAERLAAAGQDAQARGEGVVRNLEERGERMIKDFQGKGASLHEGGLASVHGMQDRATGYFASVVGGLKGEAEKLSSAGHRAQMVAEEAVRKGEHPERET